MPQNPGIDPPRISAPRLAVGTVQPEADDRVALWALLQSLQAARSSVQVFFSQSRFPAHSGATAITGRNPRHLDSWLMTPQRCRELFLWGARNAGLSVVHGPFDAARAGHPVNGHDRGGSLDALCDWLGLPRIVILDSRQAEGCRLPRRPERVDAVILDRVSTRQGGAMRTNVEALWGVPVVGEIPESTPLRALVDSLPEGVNPSPGLCESLGRCLEKSLRQDILLQLASQPGELESSDALPCRCIPDGLTVAVAYDECFQCYFPNTLDLLEAEGATIRTFSPLRDTSLPAKADLVYLGCGPLSRFASALSENVCLSQSLHAHLARGGHIYAEGSGLAYLCRSIVDREGAQHRMAGVLPAIAEHTKQTAGPTPIELRVRGLGGWDQTGGMRGYLNSHWKIHPTNHGVVQTVCEQTGEPIWMNYRNVVGSRMHVDFAAHEGLVDILLQPAVRYPLVV